MYSHLQTITLVREFPQQLNYWSNQSLRFGFPDQHFVELWLLNTVKKPSNSITYNSVVADRDPLCSVSCNLSNKIQYIKFNWHVSIYNASKRPH